MLFFLASIALAAAPDHVDLGDIDRYDGLSRDFLAGPADCWNVVGAVEWHADLGRFGDNRGSGQFIGRIMDGEWLGYRLLSLFEGVPREGSPAWRQIPGSDVHFTPLVGHHRHLSDGDQDPLGVLKVIFDELGSAVDTAYLEWSDRYGAVVLRRNVGLGKGRVAPEAEVITIFPGGGNRASSLDVFFPAKFHTGMLRWKISDAHIRIDGERDRPLPASEWLSAEVGVLGMGFSISQHIRYNDVSPCQ